MKFISIFIGNTALAVLAGALLLSSVPAKGDGIGIVLSVESVTGAPGSTGTFDVLLENTGTVSQNIAGFAFELSTTDTNITFTDVTTSTTTKPYILAGDSLFGPDILVSTTGQVIDSGDVSASGNGTDVAPGATYGIGNVGFSIGPGASNGEIAVIDISTFPNTNLTASDLSNVDFTTESGTITVQTTSTVPEPATALPLAAALLIAAFLARKRRAAVEHR